MLTWNIIFYASSAIMLLAAISLLFVKEPMHGAVYLTTSLLALAVIFYLLGAPFIAALQIILYVGAIMVLFVFFIMLSPASRTFPLTANRTVILPVILLTVMLVEAFIVLNHGHQFYAIETIKTISPKAVGADLFNHYKLAIEALSTLLLGALVAVIYLAAQMKVRHSETDKKVEDYA
ncbi:NADH-ubiquinone/plastoquinone oxidoreductase, chain 6 [Photobacterium sp. SKA34]|uniref:NADH-quinone oxidoreductase subunit J family protein n=1 Tax=Photobacterium sp. SKA34 TaxID=121723 RepID=UPI00006ACD52|nr:NADH-quinone oxidoreductase subunit J [Photobacterium sp. SKA34]EAR56483.1 NADH-ubiquinone/plastoquinone oxidoreductase, chain 6 [Photobacterium sp. SKA34]